MESYVVTEHQNFHGAKLKHGYYINFHIFGSKLAKEVFLQSEGSGGFGYSISADLNNFKILASEANFQNFEAIALCPWQA